MTALLEDCLSYVPGSEPDISAYDQAKMTAAIASCISEYLLEQGRDEYPEGEFAGINAFLLCSADFSGIQKFIFTVSTDKALASLRSRSFFLELLMEHYIDELVTALGFSGIGGKVSAGYGKFAVLAVNELEGSADTQHRWLYAAKQRSGGAQLLLTTSLPGEGELEPVLTDASYQLVRRAGFVGANADAPGKKQTQYFLDAGSVTKMRFEGDVYPVADLDTHMVYRYSKPMFLGVAL
jgi:hypothetical protein